MTTELAHPSSREKHAPGEMAIIAARGVLFWERAWPAMLPALGVAAIFIMLALFGAWRLTPGWLHGLTLGLGALVFASLVWRDLRSLRWPARRTALARLEQDGHAEHAPLQALDDTPFDAAKTANPLWRAHMTASAERARKARLAGVRPTAETRDPYGFRFIALGLITIGFVAAGADWRARLAGGFTPGALTSGGAFVADLWIEPPAYTGKAPIYLLRAGQALPDRPGQIDTPDGARLVAQINGRRRVQLRFITEDDETRAEFERDANAARTELALTQSGLLQLRLGADEVRWPIAIIADDAPAVAFTRSPAADDQGLLAFSFSAQDDYAIDAARLELRLAPEQERPLDAPAFDRTALSERRQIPLDGGARASLQQSISLNLQSDPWAGLQVIAKVVVEDGAGQTGESKSVSVTLPTRKFFNPLAKTVIEQRQTLAVAAEDWRRAGRSFDAVTMAPEVFFDDTKDYLLLRAAFWRVMRQDGDGFDDAVEKFWPLALQLEDEALELARQRLEAAQEALRQAIERGASDAEISRLIEELRQAMNDYLTALAQSGQTPEQAARNSQQLNQSDLDEMLDAIGDLAREGASNAARQMLSDLENLLNNLRVSEGGEGQGGAGAPGQGAGGEGEAGPSGEAGELIGRQRELADEAFERGQAFGETGDDLATAEDALGANLDDLIDEIEGGEADPEGDAARALGEARNDMREAEQALRNGNFNAANDAMERAIENLRDGAKRLAGEEMRQARDRQGEALDPLGRPVGEADGDGVKVPEETDAARSRAVIEELRRRLAEPGRSEEEIDYLERLLERF
ncbi:Methyl-accepting chemotaxis protein [hydrothermal vent metagenome]|uniref:Methyl-accepting chemotaxis protein n=2 Tax=hydrothermal vent metagenome TaxID=652676 RepID=A0A3B0RAB1_9ZZZZ